MVRLVAIFVSLAVAAATWFFAARFVFSAPEDAYWTEQLYIVKEQAVRHVQGRKVILVAGSSTYYDFSAAKLSQKIGLPVVNFGTHAGLGARYLLDRAARNMGPGDVVVLAMEPGLLDDDPPTWVTAAFVQFYDPGYIGRAGLQSWAPLLVGARPHYLFRSWISTGLMGAAKPHTDETGGATENMASKVTPDMRSRVTATGPTFVKINPNDPPAYLRRFLTTARQRGVTVFGAWSPMLDSPLYHDPADPQRLGATSATYKVLGVPELGAPQDFLFPLNDMFDTTYHLNDIGRAKATARLGDLICRRLKCAENAGSAVAPAL
jgi:hypothetical protein